MAEVTMVTQVASLACTNCGTTQKHNVVLIFDTVTEELRVDRTCVCSDGQAEAVKYKQTYEVSIPVV